MIPSCNGCRHESGYLCRAADTPNTRQNMRQPGAACGPEAALYVPPRIPSRVWEVAFCAFVYGVPCALILFLLVAAGMGAMRIQDAGRDCAARGGVQVKLYSGFACIKAEEIKR